MPASSLLVDPSNKSESYQKPKKKYRNGLHSNNGIHLSALIILMIKATLKRFIEQKRLSG